jgi:predicted O-methyltransferase YrrM
MVFSEHTFRDLTRDLTEHPIAGWGFALFGITEGCYAEVGPFDENFWPAYYEDIDYAIRLERAGLKRLKLEVVRPIAHDSWSTANGLGRPDWLMDGKLRNYAYLVAKWGGTGADVAYDKPFAGRPPAGWAETNRLAEIPLRWELLNQIARHIGAERYLEIGVANGDCMRRITVGERWGVDPAPSGVAEAAATKFFREPSQEFFSRHRGREPLFDLVFIDSDHRADVAYAEVQGALALLREGGVIVLHDSNPHTEAMQEVPLREGWEWTGDVWRAIVRLRWEGQHATRVVNSDYGIAVVIPGGRADVLAARPRDPGGLTYAELTERRTDLLGLVSGWEWWQWFKRTYAARRPLKAPR